MTPAETQQVVAEIKERYSFVKEARYVFNIDPCPAPRMTQGDKWKTNPYHTDPKKRQRPAVARYFSFRRGFLWLCKQQGYFLEEIVNVVFVVPMPESWSKKKKAEHYLKPHMQRPDRDNYLKALQDTFRGEDDGFVWDGRTTKIWGYEGMIILYEHA